MKRLGVIGWPVAHSLSPAIQNAALAELGLDEWHYQKLPVPPNLFDEVVRALPELDFVGVNVTLPHKRAALALATTASERAQAIGAANTLTFSGDDIAADNTDALGMIAAIGEVKQFESALVLGAGGSARAAVWALLDADLPVRIWNRTFQRAVKLCDELGGEAVIDPQPTDLIVNCTSVGLDPTENELEQLPLDPGELARARCVVDLVYRSGETELIAAARAAGARCVDGREMLIRQGAISFETWTGREAPVEVMRDAIL